MGGEGCTLRYRALKGIKITKAILYDCRTIKGKSIRESWITRILVRNGAPDYGKVNNTVTEKELKNEGERARGRQRSSSFVPHHYFFKKLKTVASECIFLCA